MPLEKGSSKAVIGHNISEMEKSGHPHKQAVAAALHTAYDSVSATAMTAAEVNKKNEEFWAPSWGESAKEGGGQTHGRPTGVARDMVYKGLDADFSPKTSAESYQHHHPKEAAETAARNKAALAKAMAPKPKKEKREPAKPNAQGFYDHIRESSQEHGDDDFSESDAVDADDAIRIGVGPTKARGSREFEARTAHSKHGTLSGFGSTTKQAVNNLHQVVRGLNRSSKGTEQGGIVGFGASPSKSSNEPKKSGDGIVEKAGTIAKRGIEYLGEMPGATSDQPVSPTGLSSLESTEERGMAQESMSTGPVGHTNSTNSHEGMAQD